MIVWFIVFLSAAFGPHILPFATEAECQRTRAELVAEVKLKAPQIGDAVHIGACERGELQIVKGGQDA